MDSHKLGGPFSCTPPLLTETSVTMAVMEYVCGGELFGLLHKAGRLPDATARFYAAEILLALEYFHGNDILYRGTAEGGGSIAAELHQAGLFGNQNIPLPNSQA